MRILFFLRWTQMSYFDNRIKMSRLLIFNDVQMICNTILFGILRRNLEWSWWWLHFIFDWSLVIGWIPFGICLCLLLFQSTDFETVFVTPMTEICHKFQLIVDFFLLRKTTLAIWNRRSEKQIVSFSVGNIQTCASIEDKLRCFEQNEKKKKNTKNWVWMFRCLWIYSALILVHIWRHFAHFRNDVPKHSLKKKIMKYETKWRDENITEKIISFSMRT